MTVPVRINELEIGSGLPKVCVPLTAKSETALCEETKNAKAAKPDLVEWRADFYEDLFEVSKTVEMAQKLKEILDDIPLLFTIRTKAEGGNVPISMMDYAELNFAAASEGKVNLVDVEVFSTDAEMLGESVAEECKLMIAEMKKNLIEKLHETDAKVIASSHDFDKTDSREILLKRFQAMEESNADILKMAVMPKCEDDVKAIMETTDKMRKEYTDKPLVSMSMGALGAISRIEGEGFGSSITFATVGAASAPGQIPINELREKMQEFHESI